MISVDTAGPSADMVHLHPIRNERLSSLVREPVRCVEYLGKHAEAEEEVTLEGGLTLPILRARYRVHGLTVVIGWIIGHPMGDFREPNSLQIDFDAFDYGMGYDAASERAERPAFEGITTSVLRSIPMAHAKALMQERYEQISIADIQRVLSPLPSRVETDC